MGARHRVIGLLAIGTALLVAPPHASAQNIFQSLFGGLFHHHRQTSEPARSFVDPFTAFARAVSPPPQGEDSGPRAAYCVRTCDGYHFVVHANATASAADMCRGFCPGSETKLYSGSNIDYATASDGSRYADLATADVYRRQLVAGCTCNGRDAFGLAHIDINKDPTLKAGDVVATGQGLMAFTGATDKVANFTPVQDYSGFSKSYRDKLSELKIAPPSLEPSDAIVSSTPQGGERSAEK